MAESTVLSSPSSSDRLYQSSRRHPRTYSHILFQKNNISKIFGPFPMAHGAQREHFRIPLLSLRTLGFFPASPTLFTPVAKRWSLTSNITPTHPTSNVTLHNHLHPINSPALTNLSTHLIFLLYHSFSKALPFKHFWALSCGPRGLPPSFSDSRNRATYPRNFPAFPPQFTPLRSGGA